MEGGNASENLEIVMESRKGAWARGLMRFCSKTQAFLVICKHSQQTGDACLRAWLLLLAGVKYNDMCIGRGFSPSNIYLLFFFCTVRVLYLL